MTWQNYKNFNYRFSTLLMIKSNSAEFRGKSRRNGKNNGFDNIFEAKMNFWVDFMQILTSRIDFYSLMH